MTCRWSWWGSRLKGLETMSKFRKIMAVGLLGLMLGASMSFFTAAPAGARTSLYCSNQVSNEEAKAQRDYDKGKITQNEYDNLMAEIAYHRTLWGC